MAEVIRSFEPFALTDLKRLADIAYSWLEDVFSRRPDTCGRYKDRLLMIALCQGGAQHFIDSQHGVKDLDVWAFFREHPEKPFPYRTVWHRDFGPSHFGRHPADEGYTGRRVDLIGRSIKASATEEPQVALRRWLVGGSESAKELANRPVIGLVPSNLMGTAVWPPNDFQ